MSLFRGTVIAAFLFLTFGEGGHFPVCQAQVGGGGDPTVTATISTTHHDTHSRVDLADAQAYSTRVLGFLFGQREGEYFEAFVYDETFPLPPDDPTVTDGFNQASQEISQVADPQSVEIDPGELVSSADSQSESVLVSEVFNHSETSVTTTTTIGPATILIGEDQSVTFFVAAGTLNINTNTHTESFIDDLFQATITHQATYQVTGHLLDDQASAVPTNANALSGSCPLKSSLLPNTSAPAFSYLWILASVASIFLFRRSEK